MNFRRRQEQSPRVRASSAPPLLSSLQALPMLLKTLLSFLSSKCPGREVCGLEVCWRLGRWAARMVMFRFISHTQRFTCWQKSSFQSLSRLISAQSSLAPSSCPRQLSGWSRIPVPRRQDRAPLQMAPTSQQPSLPTSERHGFFREL